MRGGNICGAKGGGVVCVNAGIETVCDRVGVVENVVEVADGHTAVSSGGTVGWVGGVGGGEAG